MARFYPHDPLNVPLPSSQGQSPKPEQRPWLSGRLSPRTLFGFNRSSSAPPRSASTPEEFDNLQLDSPDASAYGHSLEPPPVTQFKQLGSPTPSGQTPKPPYVAQYRQPTSPPMDQRGYGSYNPTQSPYDPVQSPPSISQDPSYRYIGGEPGSYPPPPISRFAQPTSPPMARDGYVPNKPAVPTNASENSPGPYDQHPTSVPQRNESTSLPRTGNSRFKPLSSENPVLVVADWPTSSAAPSDKFPLSANMEEDQLLQESKGKERESHGTEPSTRNENSSNSFDAYNNSASASDFILPEVFVNPSDPGGGQRILEGIGFSLSREPQAVRSLPESSRRDLLEVGRPSEQSLPGGTSDIQNDSSQSGLAELDDSPNGKPHDIHRIEEIAEETVDEKAPSARPVTPILKQRPKAVTTPPSNDLLTTMDPLAPPISRNPLASPLHKPRDVFPLFGAPSPPLPPSESFASPLLPPTTPSLGDRLSSDEVKTKPSKPTIHYDTSKPTCTLNLVCYRSGSKGCELHQIQTAKRSRFKTEAEFQRMVEEATDLIVTDEQFFRALRKVYLAKMCGFWRRVFFLKTLRGIRLLSVSTCTTGLSLPGFQT
jgi:hypothetical protein